MDLGEMFKTLMRRGDIPYIKNLSSDLWKSHKSPLWWLEGSGPPGQLRLWCITSGKVTVGLASHT